MEKNISKAKVLVCDDSMMVRNKMKKLLTAYGFTQILKQATVRRQLKSLQTSYPMLLLWTL